MGKLISLLVLSIVLGTKTLPVSAQKDPTRPLLSRPATQQVTPSAPSSKQPLTAIFLRNNKRFAIIDGKVYRTGDNYREGKIVRILDHKVVLRSAKGTYQLTLIPNIRK